MTSKVESENPERQLFQLLSRQANTQGLTLRGSYGDYRLMRWMDGRPILVGEYSRLHEVVAVLASSAKSKGKPDE